MAKEVGLDCNQPGFYSLQPNPHRPRMPGYGAGGQTSKKFSYNPRVRSERLGGSHENGIGKAIAIALLGSICCGCQTTYDTSTALGDYRSAKSCCSDFAKMNFQRLAYDKRLDVTILSTDQAYQFDKGLSYFRAFDCRLCPQNRRSL